MSLTGKVAIVTGSGRGLGLAYARELARRGASVVVNDVDQQVADDAVAAITADGGRAVAVVAPVGSTETAKALVAAAVESFGRLDILVTNAGVLRDTVLWKMSDDDFDTVINVHLRGTFTCVREAATYLREQGEGGRIISVASVAAFRPATRGAHYAASKAGIVAYTRNLAVELAPFRITVNAIAPGLTDTAQPRYGMTEEEIAAAGEQVPLGRMAQPEDMLPTVLFLCGPGGAYITGQTHHVNGGSWMP